MPLKRVNLALGPIFRINAAVLGQAVWAYVADIYGLPTIANVLYMTRITRSPENGFRLATGSFLAELALEVRDHHLRRAPSGHDLHLPSFESKKALRQAQGHLAPTFR